MELIFDPKTGMQLMLVKPVWVCPECQMEATVVKTVTTPSGVQTTYQCPQHPGSALMQQSHMVPDLTALKQNADYGWAGSRQHGDKKAWFWKRNYADLKDIVTERSVWDLPQSDVVYVVGSGPSLKKNAKLLRERAGGVVLALNDAVRYVSPDYFLAVDFVFDRVKPRHARNVTAIFPPVVPPKLARLPWKDVRWIRSGVRAPFWDDIEKHHGSLWRYWEGLNCTYAALQLVYDRLKPKTIVLVGIDCGFPDGCRHIGEPILWEPDLKVVEGPGRKPVISNDIMLAQRDYLAAQCYFLRMRGIEVINATEGGLAAEGIRPDVRVATPMTLKDAMDAVQKRKTAAVDVGEQAPDGPEVGTRKEAPTGAPARQTSQTSTVVGDTSQTSTIIDETVMEESCAS